MSSRWVWGSKSRDDWGRMCNTIFITIIFVISGLEIWRIEKLKPAPVDRSTYGKFYTGDSYICLVTRLRNSALEWDIHFWLGTETTQDEAGKSFRIVVHFGYAADFSSYSLVPNCRWGTVENRSRTKTYLLGSCSRTFWTLSSWTVFL